MKKNIILFSSFTTIIPLFTLVSCSTSSITDLRIWITKSEVTQDDIDKAIVDYNQTTSVEVRVEILNRLFTGVTNENFAHFTTNTTGNSITLIASPGYAFGTKPSIKARVVTIDFNWLR
ncbi:MAG: hypothetical protein ACRC7B_02580 [Metamycoplasmataceae bacterium]